MQKKRANNWNICIKKTPVENNFSCRKKNSRKWKFRSTQFPTRSSGESACSPPTWMKLPSLANCRCRCSGMADLAILLGMWEPARKSLLRSNSLMCSATASFLCRWTKVWRLGPHVRQATHTYSRRNPTNFSSRWIPLISKSNMKSSATRLWKNTRKHPSINDRLHEVEEIRPSEQVLVEWPCIRVQLGHNVWVVKQSLQALAQLYVGVQSDTNMLKM